LLSYCTIRVQSIGLLSSAVEGFRFFRFRLGRPYERWAMLLFVLQWTFHTWARVTWNFSTRVYTLVYARSCSACRLHLLVARLDWIQLGSGH